MDIFNKNSSKSATKSMWRTGQVSKIKRTSGIYVGLKKNERHL